MSSRLRSALGALLVGIAATFGADLDITGAPARVRFLDGADSEFAVLEGSAGFINSTVAVSAPDFVTTTGVSLNSLGRRLEAADSATIASLYATIAGQQVTISSQQETISRLTTTASPLPRTPQFGNEATCRADEAEFRSAVDLWFNDRDAAILNYGHIGTWDTSCISDMNHLFQGRTFTDNITGWDTSRVTNMAVMFAQTSGFNQDISQWNTARVTNMAYLFYLNTDFNQDLSSWNVSSVSTAHACTNHGGAVGFAHTFSHVGGTSGGAALSNCNKKRIYDSWSAQNSPQTFDTGH